MFPVRCYSCGKVIAEYILEYLERLEKGQTIGDILDELQIKRTCCRTQFFAYDPKIEKILMRYRA